MILLAKTMAKDIILNQNYFYILCIRERNIKPNWYSIKRKTIPNECHRKVEVLLEVKIK